VSSKPSCAATRKKSSYSAVPALSILNFSFFFSVCICFLRFVYSAKETERKKEGEEKCLFFFMILMCLPCIPIFCDENLGWAVEVNQIFQIFFLLRYIAIGAGVLFCINYLISQV
jgi:hypothetical protein